MDFSKDIFYFKSYQTPIVALICALLGLGLGLYLNSSPSSVKLDALLSRSLPSSPIAAQPSYYVCPMHPEIISDTAGNCPICGMDLVEKQGQVHQHSNSPFPAVSISSTTAHNLGVRTEKATLSNFQRRIETLGKITKVDLTARQIIKAPINGKLTYIAEKFDDDEIKKGELLFKISKSEKLLALEKSFQNAILDSDAERIQTLNFDLKRQGLSNEQIENLTLDDHEVTLAIYAEEDAYILERRGKIGDEVRRGFTIFNVGSGYKVVEVTAEIFERQWSWIKAGQDAVMTVSGLAGISFKGKVTRVDAPVGYTTRALEAVIKFKTENKNLSQSRFAHISILTKPKKNVLVVPNDAVIKTGAGDRVVKVLSSGEYQPVPVTTGEQAQGFIEIFSGIEAGDTVVTSGQFLIDSESNLQASLKRMQKPHAADSKHHNH